MASLPSFRLDATLTVRDWQALARKKYRGRSWEAAARRWASEHGASVVLLANDALAIFSRQNDGSVVRRTHAPGYGA